MTSALPPDVRRSTTAPPTLVTSTRSPQGFALVEDAQGLRLALLARPDVVHVAGDVLTAPDLLYRSPHVLAAASPRLRRTSPVAACAVLGSLAWSTFRLP